MELQNNFVILTGKNGRQKFAAEKLLFKVKI
jgi:hypothetical protein